MVHVTPEEKRVDSKMISNNFHNITINAPSFRVADIHDPCGGMCWATRQLLKQSVPDKKVREALNPQLVVNAVN